MDRIQWLILVTGTLTLILLAFFVIRRKWGLSESANLLTIYGIFVGVLLVFQYSPQLVKVQAEEDLRLSGIYAEQWVTYLDNTPGAKSSPTLLARLHEVPLGKFQLYIHNSGNAVASDLALEFWKTDDTDHTPIFSWIAYLFPDTSGGIPPTKSLDWSKSATGNIQVHHYEGWRRIYLPPIKPGSSLGVMVGHVYGFESDERNFMDGVRKGPMSLQLVRAMHPLRDEKLHVTNREPATVLSAITIPWGVPAHIDDY
ncbi:MAG TPA: hypothetical protein VGN86_10115 [Pyrinomonadaceae bacterium]|jgi:hypothetical protein|nr:hypothetical protein [Pyrinomonadaceae bacterium]